MCKVYGMYEVVRVMGASAENFEVELIHFVIL